MSSPTTQAVDAANQTSAVSTTTPTDEDDAVSTNVDDVVQIYFDY